MTMCYSWPIPLCILQDFYFLGEEVEKMAGKDACVHLHLLQSRIIVCRDDQVNAILEILLDDLDRPGLAIKQQIERISAPLFGVQAYMIPCSHLPTCNSYRFWRAVILTRKIPTPTTYHPFSPS